MGYSGIIMLSDLTLCFWDIVGYWEANGNMGYVVHAVVVSRPAINEDVR